MAEAIKRNRKVGLMFVDLEAQYNLTIEHGHELLEMYKDNLEVFWVALPLNLRNAVSQFEPQWMCWEPGKDWVRQPPKIAITSEDYFPFFHQRMEFEEFTPAFGHWYGKGKLTACFVGIRSDESINRYRSIARKDKKNFEGLAWTTGIGKTLYNIYPIYDWKTEDIWIYHAKTGTPYNALYDRMYQAGLSIHQMRICQPYGDDQRKGLYLYHVIEPETWAKVLARVNGANQGAIYAKESGNILGNFKIVKPEDHTWESFSMLILESLPPKAQEHYKNKIAVFLKWWEGRGYPNGIPDFADPKAEASKRVPSWRRICKALLRNDYWCKGLSFSQHKSTAYVKYLKLMERRRREWQII
jgi:predicted phosphoadenosine phosphosulfate sulfurtransferase